MKTKKQNDPILMLASRWLAFRVHRPSLSPFGRILMTAPQISSLNSSNDSPIRHKTWAQHRNNSEHHTEACHCQHFILKTRLINSSVWGKHVFNDDKLKKVQYGRRTFTEKRESHSNTIGSLGQIYSNTTLSLSCFQNHLKTKTLLSLLTLCGCWRSLGEAATFLTYWL